MGLIWWKKFGVYRQENFMGLIGKFKNTYKDKQEINEISKISNYQKMNNKK
jgi:hypothetical protein